ncbi:MAG: hypothetical protein GX620_14445 [Chloroflexi bacterium]|nr:hypothetical protein [Chloroflexota bacterium]
MKAAILAIGDELTCGYQLDTNSQTVSQRLVTIPVDVVLHIAVGDDAHAIDDALDFALATADAVIIAGGLGPTEDDLTRQVIAAHFGRALVEDPIALELMEERFTRRGRTMPESNRIQAQIPAGSQIIQNDRGTAAGFYMETGDKHIFVTPGVPFELEGMLDTFIMPRLRELVGTGHVVRRAVLKVYGVAESEINERIRPLLARTRNPLLGLLPNRGTITIEIVATGQSSTDVDPLVDTDIAYLRAEFGYYVLGEGTLSLPQAFGDLLVESGLTIASAEIGTGGMLAARLSEPTGCERWYRYGAVVNALDGAGPALNHVAAEENEAVALARHARRTAGTDIGLGIGRIVPQTESSSHRPYVSASLALDCRGQIIHQHVTFNEDRAREWIADAAIGMARMALLECRDTSIKQVTTCS